jgi:O-antigen ligase/tetratricopeptide (TPR) repeat protein
MAPATSTLIEASALQRSRSTILLRSAMEVLILLMTALAPWAFGAVHPASIFLLYLLLSVVLILWCVVLTLDRCVPVENCPVLLCIGGMVALGIWQIIPLDHATLTAVSASAASERADLYPQTPESLLGEEAVYPPTWTISFDPSATRQRVVQLLALLALFAATRFAVASPAAFRRMAIVCTINGALLSILALAQRFSSTPETIYWNYASLGSAYGPFVCRNNFSDYVNVCLFLGVGLLLRSPSMRMKNGTIVDWFAELGRNPTSLWLITAVGLMVTGILFSMSRGGLIALGGASVFCLILSVRARRMSAVFSALSLVVLLALGFIAWFGVDEIGRRLDTLSGNDPDHGRRELWARAVTLCARFPVWGSGFGTFQMVEPQTRLPGDDRLLSWEHAHNDYLEALIEGGSVNLLLLILIVGFVFRGGFRSFDRLRKHADGSLVLGGLCGFTAVVLHSAGDFGMQIPAVALLITVLLAHLTAFGDTLKPSVRPTSHLLVIPAIATCLIVAIVLPADGWFRERADHYRLAAVHAGNRLLPGDRDTVIRYLRAAADFSPDDAVIRLHLADAQYEQYQTLSKVIGVSDPVRTDLENSYLRPALRDYLRLRAINPLYEEPHARLAGNRQFLQNPDSVKNYLDRATRLRPTEEGLWYLSGLDGVSDGDFSRAWQDWRRSLICSPAHLKDILPVVISRLGPANAVDSVFTPNPSLLLRAAQTPPLSEKQEERRSFAVSAVNRIDGMSLSNKEDLYARAWLLREAGRSEDAVAAYELALQRAPNSVEWQFEIAALLFEKGDIEGAERHLRQVLQARPDLEGARQLNVAIVRARKGIR